jgi:hypothetical protein
MSFEVESNSELTVIAPMQNKIHKQKFLLDTRTCILGSIAGPCDFLPAQSNQFQKVCSNKFLWWGRMTTKQLALKSHVTSKREYHNDKMAESVNIETFVIIMS